MFKYLINKKIKLLEGDITKLNVDAIVNAANRTLLGGGGVDGAIHRAAGKQLLAECRSLNGCETGQAKITKGYKLPAKYVIHTVGPVWYGGNKNEEKLLSDCYFNSLKLAVTNNIKTIAFPSISTGVYHFPFERAAVIALTTTMNFLSEEKNNISKIYFVVYSQRDFQIFKNIIDKFIPKNPRRV